MGSEPGLGRWRRVGRGWRHLVALPVAVVFLLPLWWMITTSLRPIGQPPTLDLEWFPADPAWSNYQAVFDLLSLWRFAGNSALVVLVVVPVTILTASWAGFALAQLPAAVRSPLVLVSVSVLMVPATAIWIPRFVLFKELGLVDSRLALMAPALMGTSPSYVLLFLWTFLRIPGELFEVARLDGASAGRIWAEIAMPLSRPTIVAVAMLTFIHYWGNFLDPLIYIRSIERQTLPFALQMLFQLDRSNWPLLMAAATMVTLPVVLVFLLGQRWFLQEFRGAGWLSR